MILVCSATGSAHLTEPEGGWNYTALQTIFSQRILTSQTAATTTSASTATSPSNARPSVSDGPRNHTGAIAGGVVAGVVVLIAALLLYRARASKAKRQQSTDQRTDEGNGVDLTERNAMQVFEAPSHEPPELEPGNRFELSENPGEPPTSRFELPGR